MKKLLIVLAISVGFAQERTGPLKAIFSIDNIGSFRSTNKIALQFNYYFQRWLEVIAVAPLFWDGANGQYILVMPDQDAVIAITADIGDMGTELNLIWENILTALK